jgi:hypothetical protein
MNFQYPKFRGGGARDRLRFGRDRFEPVNQRQCHGRRHMLQCLHAAVVRSAKKPYFAGLAGPAELPNSAVRGQHDTCHQVRH